MSPPPFSLGLGRGGGYLHHLLHLIFFTIKERTISYPRANVHMFTMIGQIDNALFYSPTEHDGAVLTTNIEETRIILCKLLKSYMTNHNTHGMRHVFSNL